MTGEEACAYVGLEWQFLDADAGISRGQHTR